MNSDLNLENGSGLAEVLKGNRLKVPLNQREYKWEEDNVLDMLQDLANAMRNRLPFHFMGTIVMTKKGDEEWEIADGQQRLATTTIIFSAIRDIFLEMEDEKRAQSFEQEFLFGIDADSADVVARLTLNADDNHFFYNRIVIRPKDRPSEVTARLSSHKRLQSAYQLVREYLRDLQGQVGSQFTETLLEWRRYLLGGAKVLLLKVPESKWAFIMFATMNDRGIKTSQVDLVKNHLFQESDKRIDEAQRAWSAMRGVIESISDDDDDLVMEYMRWIACIVYGITREKEVFDRIAEKSKGPVNAVNMLASFETMANDYAALFNPEHPKWNAYSPEIRDVVSVLIDLDVKQMRPLLLSVAKNFSPTELVKTFKALISWAVRMTIAGGSKAGRLDSFYANLAHRVNSTAAKDAINSYAELLAAAKTVIPSDAEFRSEFETLRVKQSKTARYYLRCLERTAQGTKEPAWVPNADTGAVNLEHVMPRTVCDGWQATAQDVETHANRLGNLTLLQASQNVSLDRLPFAEKKAVLAQSTYLLTAMIGERFEQWTTVEIEARQKKLAEYAAATWPLKP
ncbi:MAG: DUF262 domain-containing HNH endonuclease family protein [Chthoniobacteraceae bacterium]